MPLHLRAEHDLRREFGDLRFDLEVVGERAPLPDFPVGLGEDGTRRIAILGSSGFQFFERLQSGVKAGDLLFVDAYRSGTPLMLGASARKRRSTAAS